MVPDLNAQVALKGAGGKLNLFRASGVIVGCPYFVLIPMVGGEKLNQKVRLGFGASGAQW